MSRSTTNYNATTTPTKPTKTPPTTFATPWVAAALVGGLVEEAAAVEEAPLPPLPVGVGTEALLDMDVGMDIEAVALEGIEVWMLSRGWVRGVVAAVPDPEGGVVIRDMVPVTAVLGMGEALKVSLPAAKLEQMSLPACRAWLSSLEEHLLVRHGATMGARADWVAGLHWHEMSPAAQPTLLMASVRQGICFRWEERKMVSLSSSYACFVNILRNGTRSESWIWLHGCGQQLTAQSGSPTK